MEAERGHLHDQELRGKGARTNEKARATSNPESSRWVKPPGSRGGGIGHLDLQGRVQEHAFKEGRAAPAGAPQESDGLEAELRLIMAEDVRLLHLVHNDSDVLLSLYEVLSASGFQVAASSNAMDGLAFIGRSKPRAILCRWEMPEMEAPEFIRRAKASSPHSRIIICSRQADEEKYRQVVGWGASDLILEPIRPSAVLEAFLRSMGIGVPYEHPQETGAYDLDASSPARRNGEAH